MAAPRNLRGQPVPPIPAGNVIDLGAVAARAQQQARMMPGIPVSATPDFINGTNNDIKTVIAGILTAFAHQNPAAPAEIIGQVMNECWAAIAARYMILGAVIGIKDVQGALLMDDVRVNRFELDHDFMVQLVRKHAKIAEAEASGEGDSPSDSPSLPRS